MREKSRVVLHSSSERWGGGRVQRGGVHVREMAALFSAALEKEESALRATAAEA